MFFCRQTSSRCEIQNRTIRFLKEEALSVFLKIVLLMAELNLGDPNPIKVMKI
jgi:hypothetical protein